MDKETYKRRWVAFTVGAVLLLVILLSVLIYQITSICIKKNKYNALQNQISIYKNLSESEKQTLNARQQRWWIEEQARELGYTYSDDKGLN